jgi:hypothetical protein
MFRLQIISRRVCTGRCRESAADRAPGIWLDRKETVPDTPLLLCKQPNRLQGSSRKRICLKEFAENRCNSSREHSTLPMKRS